MSQRPNMRISVLAGHLNAAKISPVVGTALAAAGITGLGLRSLRAKPYQTPTWYEPHTPPAKGRKQTKGFYLARLADGEWGVWKESTSKDIAVSPIKYETLADALADKAALAELAEHRSGTLDRSQASFESPVTKQGTKLLCQGLNYDSHREESGEKVPAGARPPWCLFFRKDEASIVGPTANIVRPRGCRNLDYEVEMGLVMQKAITSPTNITDENLLEYVAGIVLVNDMSPRDYMFKATYTQWYQGKSYRTMGPIGPWIYVLGEGEVDIIHHIRIQLSVNGKIRQDASTSELIWKPAEALTWASEFTDLAPGDVLVTGTPGGVIINGVARPIKAVLELGLSLLDHPAEKLYTWFLQARGTPNQNGKPVKSPYLQDNDVITCKASSEDGLVDLGEQCNVIHPPLEGTYVGELLGWNAP